MEIYSLTILEVKISEGIHSSALPFGAQGRRLLLTSSSFCWPQAFLGLCIPSMYAYLWLQMAFFFFLNDLFFVCVHFCQRNFTGLRGHYNSMEKAMAPHSSTLAWKIPWTEEPGRLQSMGSLRVRHDWATSLSLFTFMHWRRKWQPTPAFLPGESQGRGSLMGCCLWRRTELDTTEAT